MRSRSRPSEIAAARPLTVDGKRDVRGQYRSGHRHGREADNSRAAPATPATGSARLAPPSASLFGSIFRSCILDCSCRSRRFRRSLNAADRQVDPTFLHRFVPDVREASVDITTPAMSLPAAVRRGRRAHAGVRGVARFGEITVDPGGSPAAGPVSRRGAGLGGAGGNGLGDLRGEKARGAQERFPLRAAGRSAQLLLRTPERAAA